MKILYLIESLEVGGAEKMVVSLANGFADDAQVTICCIKRRGELEPELDPRIEMIWLDRSDGTDPGLIGQLWRQFRAGRYDLVHTHNWSVFLETAVAASLAGVPTLIHTGHGRYAPIRRTVAGRIKLRLRHLLERLVAPRYDQIVTVSDSIRDAIAGSVGLARKRIKTIHNGIDCRAAVERGERAGTTFAAVGRLVPIKRHALMIAAFGRIAAECPGARLILVGDGPERAHLEGLIAASGLAERITITGFRNDVDALLAEADVFLLVSGYEGISIALLEAMRAGLPAIATRVGGIPETVIDGRTGILIAPDDPDALAAAMTELHVDPARRRDMGRAARALAESDFSVELMQTRYRQLYFADPQPRRIRPTARRRPA